MRHLLVDFNTIMQNPDPNIDEVVLGDPEEDDVPSLEEGERMTIYDEVQQVQATAHFDGQSGM
jgi:hypothetical protein